MAISPLAGKPASKEMLVDLVRRHPEPTKDQLVVLANGGRHLPKLSRGVRQPNRLADEPDRSELRVVTFEDEPVVLDLRVGEDLRVRVHRGRQYILRREALKRFFS